MDSLEGKEWKRKAENASKNLTRARCTVDTSIGRENKRHVRAQMDISVINGKRSSCHSGRIPRTIRFFFSSTSSLPSSSLFLLLFPFFPFSSFLLCPLFTCNTSVRNRVALNESVGVYRSWQYFKSALLRQMQRVGQVRPGIHLNSLLRHI